MNLNFRLFLEVYNLTENFETPKIHHKIANWIDKKIDSPSKMLQVWRHAGKSHLFCLYVVWRLVKDPNYTCVILSAKQKIAVRNSTAIRNIIQKHPLCAHLRTNGKWSALNFTVNRTSLSLDPSVTVTSLDSDYTGTHGDELIVDDIETSHNCGSDELRTQMRERVYEFRKIANNLFFCGTPHHKDSIYTWLEEQYGVKEKLVIPIMNEKGVPAWNNHPEIVSEQTPSGRTIKYRKFSKKWIDFTRRTTPENDFKSQYMLIPANIEESLLDTKLIKRYNTEHDIRFFTPANTDKQQVHLTINGEEIKQWIGYLDTASGKQGADKTILAIVAVGGASAPNYYIHRVLEMPAIHPDDGWKPMIEAVVDVVDELFLPRLCFEKSVNLAMESDLKRAFRRRGIICSLKDVSRTINKERYILQNLQPIMDSGRCWAHTSIGKTSNFWGELEDYPKSKHDDAIDAVAGAIAEINELGFGTKPVKVDKRNTFKTKALQHNSPSY